MVYVQDTGIVKVTWYRRKFARIPQFVKSKVAHNDRYQKLLRLNVSGQKQIRSHLVIDRRSEIEFVFAQKRPSSSVTSITVFDINRSRKDGQENVALHLNTFRTFFEAIGCVH